MLLQTILSSIKHII